MKACCMGCMTPSMARLSMVVDVLAVGLHGEHGAAFDGFSVEVQGAGTA